MPCLKAHSCLLYIIRLLFSLPLFPASFSMSVSQSHFSPHSAVVALLLGLWVLERRGLPWSQNIAYKHSV